MDEQVHNDLLELPSIPESSAQAYKENLAALVAKVNKIMSSRADINLLIGDNPKQMMFDNHKNHGIFMSNVFALQRYSLLMYTILWVYRAYHSQGFSYAYFPAHLHAWRTALQETLPEDTSKPLRAIYDWMLSRHEDFIAWSQEPRFAPPEPDEAWWDLYQDFVQALIRGDKQKILQLGKEAVRSSGELASFYLQILQPAMYTVGQMWEQGEISVAKEHLASALINRLMSMQYIDLMRPPEKKRGKAVVSAASNEFHEIGATMVANCLELDGWDVEYLGANMPLDELLLHVAAYEPDILALSVAMPFNLEAVQDVIQNISTWEARPRPKIMVGGLAFHELPDLAEQIGADGYAADCSQAVQTARKWQRKQA
ncbi:MAG: cobalamin-dependent protein [Desulfovermiculus sp.]